MDIELEALKNASATGRPEHRPEFFRLALPGEEDRLRGLLKRTPAIRVHDELHSQLRELVRAQNPSIRYTLDALDAAAKARLGSAPASHYGVWVYYPWSGRLVHLLDEAEFIEVRTDRNRNKITREEQRILSTRKVGVIGLSVGQSAALALVQERSIGEIRLADMDTLDLSNLNRIRSGVHQLGSLKTVNTAREIAEIDPFIHVTCFHEGVTTENVERFLLDGGKLDLLVEECDSIGMKIVARQHAKAHRIPVVMDTSDRGLIDVERFDLEPDRPILHGAVDHLDLRLAASARTNEEKLPFVVPILGLDTMSKRMKASMLEIESSVTTWPQLASSVLLGGALVADIHRRIALGSFTSSGRWFVDPEERISDTKDKKTGRTASDHVSPGLTFEHVAGLTNQLPAPDHEGWSEQDGVALCAAGNLAPSAGNLQPWRFLLDQGRLFVFHDGSVGDSELDGARLIPNLDMGACLENIRLKALELGWNAAITAYPIPDEHRLVAVVDRGTPATSHDALSTMLPQRCSNRKKGDARDLPQEMIAPLREAASAVMGCDLHVLHRRDALDRMAEVIGEAERLRVLNPIGHRELFIKEFRWSEAEALRTRDGLDLPSFELKKTEEVAFRVAADRAAMDLLADWDGGRAFIKLNRENLASASGLMLITTRADRPHAWLEAGRAMQRAWLKATAIGLAVHPCAAPILLSHHVRFGGGDGFSGSHKRSLLELKNALCAAFGLVDSQEPAFMMRLSFASAPSARSMRRPIEQLMFANKQVEN